MFPLNVLSHVIGVATRVAALVALPVLAAVGGPEGGHLGPHLTLQQVLQMPCTGEHTNTSAHQGGHCFKSPAGRYRTQTEKKKFS